MSADDGVGLPDWLEQLRSSLRSTGEDPVWAGRLGIPTGTPARAASVLILFDEDQHGPSLLFIERAATLRSHPGQVAFPGGGADPGDIDSVATALREAKEEIGLEPSGVDILGELPTITVPVSGFRVTPVLGWWRTHSEIGVRDPAEVAAVRQIPIADLADPDNRYAVQHPRGPGGPGFQIDDLLIWGMTAYLVDNVLSRTGWHRPWNRRRSVPVPSRFLGSYPDGSPGPGKDPAVAMTEESGLDDL